MRNLIFDRDDHSAIVLTNGEEVLVDKEDVEVLETYKWTKSKLGYSSGYKNRESYFMHRVIMGLSRGDGLLVDHVNGNGLDNRRQNLRVCSKVQNQQNQKPRHTAASQFKGVGYFKREIKNGVLG